MDDRQSVDINIETIWSIPAEKVDGLNAALGEVIQKGFEQIQAAYDSRRDGSDEELYQIVNGNTAVIQLYGVLRKRTYYSFFYSATSYQTAETKILAALDDHRIKNIVLDIDSPGGTVDGVKGTADLVRESSKIKPITAYANGQMTSAAYWIGSAAGNVVANETAIIGSIGVLAVHRDYSENDKKYGIKTTIITSGKYKALTHPDQPLSKEGKEQIQGQADYFYSLFVQDIANNRGVSVETVTSEMAEGRVFIGKQALDAGLVDQIGTLETAINISNQSLLNRKVSEMAKDEVLTIESLEKDHSAIVAEISQRAVKTVDTKALVDQGTETEQARILGLIEVHFGKKESDKFKA